MTYNKEPGGLALICILVVFLKENDHMFAYLHILVHSFKWSVVK